jgi:ubiquinone/menaquinone biosynthesis C-methylase UbiE
MELFVRVSRGDDHRDIQPSAFSTFAFQSGDALRVLPEDKAANLPKSWADTCIEIAPGHSIRVPPKFDFFDYRGFRIPEHLVALTGAGSATFEAVGRAHIEHFQRFVGIVPGMTVLEMGCGIGRDAFQMFDLLGSAGRYVGIDVTQDSIQWCQRNITPRHPNFTFDHFDAYSELYNPFGRKRTTDFTIPVPDGSIDRVVLTSVFTHMLEDEVLHYMREFRRVLKSDGSVYANFFVISDAVLEAARRTNNTPFAKDFAHYGNGRYGADPAHPRGAVGYTNEALHRMMSDAGLKATSYVKGWWSGFYGDAAEDGQDALILARS